MKRPIATLFVALLCLGLLLPPATRAQSYRKLAQTGFQFLSVGVEARAAAMAEAYTTVAGYSNSIYYNPANLARSNAFLDVGLSRNEWIADIVYNAGSLAVRPANGEYGAFAVSVLSVDYGEFLGTRVDPTTDQGYVDTGVFSPTAYAVGLGYAKSLSDRFSVGGHVKYASQSLGSSTLPVGNVADGVTEDVKNNLGVVAFDFGTFYQTAIKSLAFGMTVRNFSQEVEFQRESFQLPLTFRIGISMNVLDFFMAENRDHSFVVAIDAIHPRDYSEQLNIGGEYTFKNLIAVRGGYLYNYDEQDLTAGFGIQKFSGNRGFAIDYAYTPFGVFDSVSRFTVRFAL